MLLGVAIAGALERPFYVCVFLFRPSDYGMDEDTTRFMAKMEDTVRSTFKFHPHIQAVADATVADVARRVVQSKNDVTYVGIHNRRTDHLNFTLKADRAKPLKPKYFREAMEYFRYFSLRDG